MQVMDSPPQRIGKGSLFIRSYGKSLGGTCLVIRYVGFPIPTNRCQSVSGPLLVISA